MQDSAMLPNPEDTIVALSSAPGPGLRAIVRYRFAGPANRATVFDAEEQHCAGSTPSLRWAYGSLACIRHYRPTCMSPRRRGHIPAKELVEIHTISSPPLIDLLIATLICPPGAGGSSGRVHSESISGR